MAKARREGATDIEIHDTVLIAAAFCMFTRYVDGLGNWGVKDAEDMADEAAPEAHTGCLHDILHLTGQGPDGFLLTALFRPTYPFEAGKSPWRADPAAMTASMLTWNGESA